MLTALGAAAWWCGAMVVQAVPNLIGGVGAWMVSRWMDRRKYGNGGDGKLNY